MQHYYQMFDSDRSQLGSIYVSVTEPRFHSDFLPQGWAALVDQLFIYECNANLPMRLKSESA